MKGSKTPRKPVKKPDFKRQESWRYKRIKEGWRRPRGIDNKMRQKRKGWPATPEKGYRSPRETRGLHPSGYVEVTVRNVEDVIKVDPETQAIRIAHTVGNRKRMTIVDKAEEMEIHILNPRVVEEEPEEELEEELAEEPEEELGEPLEEMPEDDTELDVESEAESDVEEES